MSAKITQAELDDGLRRLEAMPKDRLACSRSNCGWCSRCLWYVWAARHAEGMLLLLNGLKDRLEALSNMVAVPASSAERAERDRHRIERGCGCGYWDEDAKRLDYPHAKCSCAQAVKLREEDSR